MISTNINTSKTNNTPVVMQHACMDSPLRSLFKAIMWRILASVITFIISYVVTTEVYMSSIIMLIDMCVKIIAYYTHERIWTKIKFGLVKMS